MNNKKSLIYSLIAVLLIAAIVAGGTFAYFQWTSGTSDRSNVNVTIEAGQITMHIEPENTVMDGVRPTNNCNNAVAYGDALATIVNNTGAMAIPSFKLKAKVTKNGTGELDSDDLKHIHYSVVLLETNSRTGAKGDTVLNDGACNNPSNFTVSNENIYFTGLLTGSATGTFETVSTNGEWSDLPNTSGTYLPRQFNTETVTPYGVTFLGMPHTTSYQWFRVYVWMDADYTFTNTGTDITDPLQNAKIEVTWSENTMLEQVSSQAVGGDTGEVKAPGLYASDGTFTSWDELVFSEIDVHINGSIIGSSESLLGELVISDSVTSIGMNAFYNSSLTSVVIPDSVTTIGTGAFEDSKITSVVIGNSVTIIGGYAFYGTKLKSVVIPNSVTSIEAGAFESTDLENVIIGNLVTSIGENAFYETKLRSVAIPDSVTTIENQAFDTNSSLESVVIPKTTTYIGFLAFGDDSLTDVYYKGTEEEWNAINIVFYDDVYDSLFDANIHYNYKGE